MLGGDGNLHLPTQETYKVSAPSSRATRAIDVELHDPLSAILGSPSTCLTLSGFFGLWVSGSPSRVDGFLGVWLLSSQVSGLLGCWISGIKGVVSLRQQRQNQATRL